MRFKLVSPDQEQRAIKNWIQRHRKRLFSLMALGKHDEFNRLSRLIEQADAKLMESRRLGLLASGAHPMLQPGQHDAQRTGSSPPI